MKTGVEKAQIDARLESLWVEWKKAASEGRATLAAELRAMYLALLDRRDAA